MIEQVDDFLEDPAREGLLRLTQDQLPKVIEALGPRLQGEPAFDPEFINWVAGNIQSLSGGNFSNRQMERVVKVGLAHIDATFDGDHPKYGVGAYAAPEHDGFPPTIVAAVDALTLWGLHDRAKQLFSYWLQSFVQDDGSVRYYGTSLSEYGQLLTTARRVLHRTGDKFWLLDNLTPIKRLAAFVRAVIRDEGRIDLPMGVPEADESEFGATYFHNSAWLARGLFDWSALLRDSLHRDEEAEEVNKEGHELRGALIVAMEEAWSEDGWWLRPMREKESPGYFEAPARCITANRLGSYTNYRYWPELLGSNVLTSDLATRIVKARLNGGGQHIGVTRFEQHLDDWPLMDYLDGLRRLGMWEDYRISVWGHVFYHQAEGHLTAYEQVTFPPGTKKADYCLPCQLVATRATAPRTDDL